MRKKVKVVIGANFGDEGKGLMTDYFASQDENALVVRFNGGAQAGHTVVTPEGLEHVFSHFGSGSLLGRRTYLSRFFISNPIMFRKEYEILYPKIRGNFPLIYVDRESILSTPFDMLINQAVETVRGDSRHGSCGLGISETVVRCENTAYRTTVGMLFDKLMTPSGFRGILEVIRSKYVPARLQELGLSLADLPEPYVSLLNDDGVIDAFLDDCRFFLGRVKVCSVGILRDVDYIVFEGAQGLLLDQDLVEFSPHITHTSTGVKNVLQVLRDLKGYLPSVSYDLEVCYVTRAYLTRHGAGPMPNELVQAPYAGIYDPTNVPNPWQGTLRFGYLDVDFLREYIGRDVVYLTDWDCKVTLAVTCMDQVPDIIDVFAQNGKIAVSRDTFLWFLGCYLSNRVQVQGFYASWGRTRDHIIQTV